MSESTAKPWYQSRTMLLNIAAGALAGVSGAVPEMQLTPAQYQGTAAALAAANVILRMLTEKPIRRRK